MGARFRQFLFVGGLLFCGVTTATASVGSIISSFRVWVVYPPEMTAGVYRDADYVYIVTYDYSSYFYVYRYRPDGSFAGWVELSGGLPRNYPPDSADHSVLGPGYITFSFGNGELLTYSLPSGSLVEISSSPMSFDYYAYIPAGDYIYTQGGGLIYRLTTAWNVVNSFPATGILGAATRAFNGCIGEYIITEYGSPDNYAYVYTGDGSFVSSFSALYSRKDPTCGPGYPSSYGTTYWRFIKTSSDYGWCYQIDLGATTHVVPASLGKIKAIYR